MSFPKYEAYKDSGVEWLGEVPEHWEITPLKYNSSFNDQTLSDATPENYEIEYVEISDVDEVQGITGTTSYIFSDAPSRARRIIQDGDVLISTVRTYLRSIAPVVDPPKNLIASTGFAVIRPQEDGLRGEYLGYLLRAEWWIAEIISQSVGVSYPAINASDLVGIKVPVPGISEQTQIARFLDHETARIDALIAEQQRLIELLKEKRQAVISHAVTKGLDAIAPMKDSGVEWLGEVPVHWEVGSLGYYSKIDTGATPDRSKPEYWDGDVPWIKTGEVKYETIFQAEEYTSIEGVNNSAARIAPKGTLLMAMYGQGVTRGRVAILGIDAAYNQACAGISVKPQLQVRFLRDYLMAAYPYIRDDGNETSQMNLSSGYIAKIKVTVPPIQEQVTISDFIERETEKFDSLISEATSVAVLLQERRSALISAAVTGKIDVRGWQAPTSAAPTLEPAHG